MEDYVARPDRISGADINAICQEAGMQAVRENRYIVLPKDFEKGYKNNIKKCTQIQSLAYSTMGLIRKNTPCAAIDVILNNMPLDLYISGHAAMSNFRLRGHETVDPV